MRVSKEVWEERMNNLNERRNREVIKNVVNGVDDYCSHINSVFIGKKTLDVGCGSMIIKKCLPKDVEYIGIDPYPNNDQVIKMQVEDCTFADNYFETVYCFAMLDNVIDLRKAIEQIKRICAKNVLILTGINIPPDKYHTVEITRYLLDNLFHPFTPNLVRQFHEKIILIEYKHPDFEN